MGKLFALLGILLILSGVIVLGAPYFAEPRTAAIENGLERRPFGTRSVEIDRPPTLVSRVREVAEKANAPLSILFGLMSLYYTRRTYYAHRNR